jgi:hypothetical protein
MPVFRIILEGRGIVVPHEAGDPDPIIGFFTTRVRRASDLEEAAAKAKSSVMEEWSRAPWTESNKGTPPTLSIVEIMTLGFIASLFTKQGGAGHAFYADADSRILAWEVELEAGGLNPANRPAP